MSQESGNSPQTEVASHFPGQMLSDYCSTVKYDDSVDNFLANLTPPSVLSVSLERRRSFTPPGTEVRYRSFYVLATDNGPSSTPEKPIVPPEGFQLHVASDEDLENYPPQNFYQPTRVRKVELPVVTDFECDNPERFVYRCQNLVSNDMKNRLMRGPGIREMMGNIGHSVTKMASLAMSPILSGVDYRFRVESDGFLVRTNSTLYFSRQMMAASGLIRKIVISREAQNQKNSHKAVIPNWMYEAIRPDQSQATGRDMALSLLTFYQTR
jgi:hypothetical protein